MSRGTIWLRWGEKHVNASPERVVGQVPEIVAGLVGAAKSQRLTPLFRALIYKTTELEMPAQIMRGLYADCGLIPRAVRWRVNARLGIKSGQSKRRQAIARPYSR